MRSRVRAICLVVPPGVSDYETDDERNRGDDCDGDHEQYSPTRDTHDCILRINSFDSLGTGFVAEPTQVGLALRLSPGDRRLLTGLVRACARAYWCRTRALNIRHFLAH
jgi:hypothetical protein